MAGMDHVRAQYFSPDGMKWGVVIVPVPEGCEPQEAQVLVREAVRAAVHARRAGEGGDEKPAGAP